MLQVGHGEKGSIRSAITTLQTLSVQANKPIVMSEINYEGILGKNDHHIQRASFWCSILNGANGFTYGANGIWQINHINHPFGNSPSGDNWGDTPWNEAMQKPGSTQLAHSVKLLKKFAWWLLEPVNESLIQPFSIDPMQKIWCASIKKETYILYSINKHALFRFRKIQLQGLHTNTNYYLYMYNLEEGTLQLLQTITTNTQGNWKIPRLRFTGDWLLIANLKEISI
jgi:hypothetical protein